MAAEETLYAEVLSAIDSGDKTRARDLLSRLLKTNPENPRYWLWMSAVVETPKERVYCLKEVLRRDPTNETARRGLIFSGAATDAAIAAPAALPRRNWQAALAGEIRPARPVWQTAVTAGGAALLLVLVLLGVFGGRIFSAIREAGVERLPTVDVSMLALPSPTATLPAKAAATQQGSPQPLWMRLEATYTATPLAVNTPHPRTEAYRSAQRAYERGEWSAALNLFQQVVTAEPDAVDALYYMGEVTRLDGDPAAALELYRQAIARDAEFAPAYLGEARALLAANPKSVNDARKALETAIELDPALVEAYTELSALLVGQGESQAALELLASAPSAALDSPLFLLAQSRADLAAGQAEDAARAAAGAIKLDVTLLAAYRAQAEALIQTGDARAALAPLQTYTAYQAEDAQSLAWLGKAYLADEQPGKALDAFERALALDDTLADAYIERGLLYLEREDGERALADFETGYKTLPRSFPAALGLARAQLLQDEAGSAYMQLNRAEGLAKTDAEKAQLHYWRALALERLPDQTAQVRSAAVRDWEALLALPETNAPAAWSVEAQKHLAALYTPTVTPRPATATPTPKATRAPQKSSTPTRKP